MVRNKVYGSETREFEAMLSSFFDNSYSLAVSNASVGILGVFYSLGIVNSEIITTPLTWPGAITPLMMLNNKIVYGTIEEPTLTLNPDTLESLITPKTKVVFSADFLGYPCRLDEMKRICDKHNLLLIHDAASSMGSLYNAKYSGYYADVTIYSFGRNKPFTTGEGGVVITKSGEIYSKLVEHITHPERQNIEMDLYNPFFINSSLNPLAVNYGLKTFKTQIEKINNHRIKTIDFFSSLNIEELYIKNDMLPNFYKPVVNTNKYRELFNSDEYANLPFLPLSSQTGLTSDIINSYKVLKNMCLVNE